MTPAEIFNNVGSRFQSDKAAGIDMKLVFDLSGDNGGQWSIIVADGQFEMKEEAVDEPTATIKMDGDDYVAMTTGELNPMMAFMSGKVKVDGNLDSVLKFQSLFGL
jgi:putative sterol carrier protein